MVDISTLAAAAARENTDSVVVQPTGDVAPQTLTLTHLIAGLQSASDVDALIATAVTALVDGAPANRNTLGELSTHLDTKLNAEGARDAIAAILTEGNGVTITYVDDGANAGTLTIAADLALSDDAPRSVTTGANAAGTATDAARRDHHHQVVAASTTQAGISERATNAEAVTGTDNERHLTSLRASQIFDARASDAQPLEPTTLGTSGTSTDFSRSDHAHPEGTGGAGVTLSDDAPRSVTTGANAAGTATDAARRDHHHQVAAATTTQAGISERATDAETRTGTSTTRVITPSNLTAGLDNRASDDSPEAPTSVAAAGTSTDFSRSDHSHVQEGTGGDGDADGTVLNGNGVPAGNSGKDGDTYRDDETGAWYKKSSGAWSAALYTPTIVSGLTGTTIVAGADNIPFEDVSGGDENKISVRDFTAH